MGSQSPWGVTQGFLSLLWFLGLKAGNQIEAVFKFESKRKH